MYDACLFIFNDKFTLFQVIIHFFCFAMKEPITDTRQFFCLGLFGFIKREPLRET